MPSTFVIEQDATGYRFRLRRRDGTVLVEGPVRGSHRECERDIRELERLVAEAAAQRSHPDLAWQARAASP